LVALVDDTVFDVWPYAIRFDGKRVCKPMQIRLRAGDVVIFRSDLVHAGAAVGDVENVRIHAYLDVEGVMRLKQRVGGVEVEETHFMCDEKYILKR
jgi:ectoine hydroxylase-related dioxygenase (phytanoyl-CoA dioxygenase family)